MQYQAIASNATQEFNIESNTSITVNVKRNTGYRSAVFLFGVYGECAIFGIDDGIHGKGVSTNLIKGSLSSTLISDDGSKVSFVIDGLHVWSYCKLIACNCVFI